MVHCQLTKVLSNMGWHLIDLQNNPLKQMTNKKLQRLKILYQDFLTWKGRSIFLFLKMAIPDLFLCIFSSFRHVIIEIQI